MHPAERQFFLDFEGELSNFAGNTKKAVNELLLGHQHINEELLNMLIGEITRLDQKTEKIKEIPDSEMRLEMQLVKNILHQPLYPDIHHNKKVSIIQAAKKAQESNDYHDINSIFKACAKNSETTKTLIDNLYQISKAIKQSAKG